MPLKVCRIDVDGAELKEGDVFIEGNSDVVILSGNDLEGNEFQLGNEEEDEKLVVEGMDEEVGRVDTERAVLVVGCVDLFGKGLK